MMMDFSRDIPSDDDETFPGMGPKVESKERVRIPVTRITGVINGGPAVKTYKIPVRICGKKARNKACIDYIQAYPDGGLNAPKYSPAPGAKIVTITAKTHAEAARKLQAIVLPDDPRPIMSRTDVKLFVES